MDAKIKTLNKLKLLVGSNKVYAIKYIAGQATLASIDEVNINEDVYQNLFVVKTQDNYYTTGYNSGNIVYIDNDGKYKIISENVEIAYMNKTGECLKTLVNNKYAICLRDIHTTEKNINRIITREGEVIDINSCNVIYSLIDKIDMTEDCKDINFANFTDKIRQGRHTLESGKYRLNRVNITVDRTEYRNVIEYVENKLGYNSAYRERAFGDLDNNRIIDFGEHVGIGYSLSKIEARTIGSETTELSDIEILEKFEMHDDRHTGDVIEWVMSEYSFGNAVICYKSKFCEDNPEEYREIQIEVKDTAEFEIIDLGIEASKKDIIYNLNSSSLQTILPLHGVYKAYKSKEYNTLEYNYSGAFLNMLNCDKMRYCIAVI